MRKVWADWLITLCDPERFAVPTLGSAAVKLTLPQPVPPRPRVSPELEARFPTQPEEVEEHERRVHEFEQQLSMLNAQLAIADAEVAEAARAAADAVWQPPVAHPAAAPAAAATATPEVPALCTECHTTDESDDSESDDDSMSESELGACLLGL